MAALLGLLGYGIWKRRRNVEDAPVSHEEDIAPPLADPALDETAAAAADNVTENTPADSAATTLSSTQESTDVDALAEADMYLAYGRDVQAEEILREALRKQPENLPVLMKLAEIYVKRQDIKSLEDIARSMQAFCATDHPDMQQVMAMGRELDASHPYFASADNTTPTSTAQTTAPQATSAFAAALNSAKGDLRSPVNTANAAAMAETTAATANALDEFDLNLDSLETTTTPPAPTMAEKSEDDFAAFLDAASGLDAPPPAQTSTPLPAEPSQDLSHLDLDMSAFDIPVSSPTPAAAVPPAVTAPAPVTAEDALDLDLSLPEIPAANAAAEPVAPAPAPANNSMEFDLGSLDLDLGTDPAPAAPSQPVHNLASDPLSTKLDLAQEFNTIGDSEGARSLIQEVLAEASGPLKERAQKMLSELD